MLNNSGNGIATRIITDNFEFAEVMDDVCFDSSDRNVAGEDKSERKQEE
jgi:hypothetical protein